MTTLASYFLCGGRNSEGIFQAIFSQEHDIMRII